MVVVVGGFDDGVRDSDDGGSAAGGRPGALPPDTRPLVIATSVEPVVADQQHWLSEARRRELRLL